MRVVDDFLWQEVAVTYVCCLRRLVRCPHVYRQQLWCVFVAIACRELTQQIGEVNLPRLSRLFLSALPPFVFIFLPEGSLLHSALQKKVQESAVCIFAKPHRWQDFDVTQNSASPRCAPVQQLATLDQAAASVAT